MEYDHETQVFNFIAGLVLGAVIGAGIAILTAPESGKRTRRRVRKMAGEIRKNAGTRIEDMTDDVRGRVDDVRGRVDDAVKGARKRLS